MLKFRFIKLVSLVVSVVLIFTGCSSNDKKITKEPVVADGLCKFNVEGETDLPGNFYLSFVYSRNLIMLDGKGKIVWSKHEDPVAEGTKTGFWDFKKHVINGKTYYSYHDQTGEYDNYGLEGYAPGERVILDENFNEVKRIKFEKSLVTEKGAPLDGHDFLMIDLDHYILSGFIKDKVYNIPSYPQGSSVLYSYLQEVDSGEVVWDWRSIDYPQLYDLTVTDASDTANDFANAKTDVPDYVHFNAMRLDDDGNLICSFRHLSSIMCLDRSTREGQIRWILSGKGDQFGLNEIQKTSGQHYVSIDGDYIMLFDNGNKNGSTRIGEYKINTETKKLDVYKSYALGNKFTRACGSVQHLRDELYTIGWGIATNDAECMSVVDFAKGTTLMKVTLEDKQNVTYRCAYYD